MGNRGIVKEIGLAFATWILSFHAQASDSAKKYPPLVGKYDVSYKFFGRSYQTEDLVYNKGSRRLSYAVLYPSKPGTGKKIKLNDLNPTTSDFDPVEFKYKDALADLGKDSPTYDLAKAIFTLKQFYEEYQLNSTKNGEIIKSNKFPVLIFSPGAGGQRDSYLGFLEQIASLGVIVVALDQHQWEAVEQVVYDESTGCRYKYLDRPDFDNLPRHSHHHMRALDMQQVYNDIKNQTDPIFSQADTDKIFISGHSYGGHTAFYSIRMGMKVKGHINYDGDFTPYGDEDHYDPNRKKLNTHLLCANDGPANENHCKKLFEGFERENIQKELDSFKFSTLTSMDGISHFDFGNWTLLEEDSPHVLPNSDRHTRPSTKKIWHKLAKWTYEIVK